MSRRLHPIPNHSLHKNHPKGDQQQSADFPPVATLTPFAHNSSSTPSNTANTLQLAEKFPKRMRSNNLADATSSSDIVNVNTIGSQIPNTTYAPRRNSKRLCRQKPTPADCREPVIPKVSRLSGRRNPQQPAIIQPSNMSPTVIVASPHLHLTPLSSEPIVDPSVGTSSSTPPQSSSSVSAALETEKSPAPSAEASTSTRSTSLHTATVAPSHIKKAVQTKPFPIRGKLGLKLVLYYFEVYSEVYLFFFCCLMNRLTDLRY